MDGFSVFDSYQRYKFGQDSFISWLKETSDKCGYSDGLSNTSKSKTTKKAKTKKQKQVASSALSSSTVPIAELTSRAQKIAQSAENIPRSILQILKDVIVQRRKVQDFFARKKLDDADNNDGHLYIIIVLETVMSTLDSAVKVRKSEDPKPEGISAGRESSIEDRLKNGFDVLEVEEPGLEPLGSSAIKMEPLKSDKRRKEPKAKDTAFPDLFANTTNPKYELERSKDDEYFLIYCFFADFNQIRDELQELWCDYQEGSVRLTAVAVVTNTAFEMFQRAEKNFMLAMPDNSTMRTYKKISDMLMFETGFAHQDYSKKADEQQKEVFFEDADWICLPVYWAITDFIAHVPQGKIPMNPEFNQMGLAGMADYGVGAEGKFDRNKNILMHTLMEACIMKAEMRHQFKPGDEIPGEDELTKGLVQMLKTRKVPIWLLFALQVYLDIRFIMEADVDRGHKELLSTGKRHKQTLDDHLEANKDMYPRPPDFMTHIQAMIDCWIVEDFMENTRGKILDDHKLTRQDQEYFYIRRNPILCGLMVFYFDLTMNELAIDCVNSWDHIMAALHIYNAIKQEIPNTREWQDMNALISIHGAEHVFVGGAPTNPLEYGKKFELAMGASITNFARDSKHDISQKGFTGSRRGARGFRPQSAVSQIFHARYCLREPILTLSNIEKLLNDEIRAVRERSPSSSHSKNTSIFHEKRLNTIMQCIDTKVLDSVQLLDVLFIRISDEYLELLFNYLSMHQRCTEFLRDVYDEFRAEVDTVAQGVLIEKAGDLPELARFVFGALGREAAPEMGFNLNTAERVKAILDEYTEDLVGNFEILSSLEINLEFRKKNGFEISRLDQIESKDRAKDEALDEDEVLGGLTRLKV